MKNFIVTDIVAKELVIESRYELTTTVRPPLLGEPFIDEHGEILVFDDKEAPAIMPRRILIRK